MSVEDSTMFTSSLTISRRQLSIQILSNILWYNQQSHDLLEFYNGKYYNSVSKWHSNLHPGS